MFKETYKGLDSNKVIETEYVSKHFLLYIEVLMFR